MAKNKEKIESKIEGEAWEKALDKSFKKNVKNVKMDGFRKGAVPKDIYLEKVGIESLYNDAIEEVIDDAYKKALEKSSIEPVVQPQADVTNVSKDGVTFEFTIIGKPIVKLGEYKNLKVIKDKVNITDEEVLEEIEHLRSDFAEIKVKDGGVVESGDTAVIDFKGYVDGEELEGGSGANYPLEIGTNTFIPGFEDGVLGMSVGEEKTLHLQFPENYTKDLAGKKVDFDVTLREIKTRILPDIDEAFFEDLGYDKVTNEDELKSEVKKVLEEKKQQVVDDEYIEKILSKASENMEIDIPEEVIDDEIHRMIHQFESQLKMQGMNIDQYMEFSGQTHEDLHKNMEGEATKRIKYRYLLEEVAKVENIVVSDEEAEKDAEEMAKNYGITKEELVKAFGGMEVVKFDAQMRKTLDFLKNN